MALEIFARSNLKIEGIESLVRSITSESINATANGNTNANLNKERAGVF